MVVSEISLTKSLQVTSSSWGDNRANSSDSRIWSAVFNGNLHGIASHVWWAKQRDSVSWARFGQSLD